MIKKANVFLTLSILLGVYIIYAIVNTIKNIRHYEAGDYIVISIICVLLIFVAVSILKKYKKYSSVEYLKQEAKEQEEKRGRKNLNNNPYMSEDDYTNIDSGKLIVIQTNDFIYKPNELCHYASYAKRLIIKNETVGHTGRSSGITVRIARGLSYRTGGGRSKAIKKDVGYFFDGSLFITNQRVIFISHKNGFEIPLKKLTAIQIVKDGLIFQVNDKNYLISVERQEYPYTISNILIQENVS